MTERQRPDRPSISRRRFLETGAAAAFAAPALLLGSTASAARSVSGHQPGPDPALVGERPAAPSNRITMGLIGCGGMGRANLNAFIGQPDVQVLAVCDPDRSRREATRAAVNQHYASRTTDGTWSGCDAYNDYRDLLARRDIDVIIQATPDHWHAPVVIAAAQAGKDIYGEKPLSLTIAEGRAMSDAVARYGRVFQTGSQQRSDDRFRFACELVRNGRIGRVQRVVCGLPTGPFTGNQPAIPVPEGFDYNLWLGPAPWAPYCESRTHWNFRWILDYSGGQVTDWGAHHIDIAHWGLGLEQTGPTEVEGKGEFPPDGLYTAATNYAFTAKYASGVEITITNKFENGVRWDGPDGWVFVTRGRIDAEPKSLLESPIAPTEVHLPRSAGGHHRNFLDCVKSRQEPIAPIEQAHRTITVSHLGNIAMLLGRKIRWNPDRELVLGDATAQRMLSRTPRNFDDERSWRI